ncbi:MAG: hypothetical protein V4494_05200 [Chlamydiota bacterium]
MLKKTLLLVIFLSSAYCQEVSPPIPSPPATSSTIFHDLSEKALYLGAGSVLSSISFIAKLGWAICLVSPWTSNISNECYLLSTLCERTAKRLFTHTFTKSHSSFSSFEGIPPAYHSWYLNQALLSQIPTFSEEDKKLLFFLEKRWLAKATGFFSSVIHWLCPCFKIFMQVHPETTNSYARDPSNKFSHTYLNRVEEWKQSLPHPEQYPLILTRPFDCHEYLPSYIGAAQYEKIETILERCALQIRTLNSKVVVDLTQVLPQDASDKELWIKAWNAYRAVFSQRCKKLNLDPSHIICIQTVKQEEIGGIRLLPLIDAPSNTLNQHHHFLLEWISKFGISANRIELDRWTGIPTSSSHSSLPIPFQSKEEFVSYLDFFDHTWKSDQPEKTLMVAGALQLLKGLCAHISDTQWNEIISSKAKLSVIQLSFLKIQEQFNDLAQEKKEAPFYDTAYHVEQIQANLTALLEIFKPFTPHDFLVIYSAALTSIPEGLKPLTSYGIHTSAMTSLSGIFKVLEKTLGRPPRVFFGENTYFEIIRIAELISENSSIPNIVEKNWENVDLILAQFNPVLKRIDLPPKEYQVEPVAEILHQCLNARQGKPVTLGLDCTLDFINSKKVNQLLTEFQQELERGALNIICYRSGVKFDLFGMDNYCGAPFYMIHNQDEKWAPFDALLTDPVLQTDSLSLNWFCLAYQNATPQLELYRKLIFDNTRALLDKIPKRLLYDKNTTYRVIPSAKDADLGFIDIKIFTSLHVLRGGLIGGLFTLKCMEEGHLVFYRPSLGFYHPNLSTIFGEDSTTIRLTLGLDPSQIDILQECFNTINAL